MSSRALNSDPQLLLKRYPGTISRRQVKFADQLFRLLSTRVQVFLANRYVCRRLAVLALLVSRATPF